VQLKSTETTEWFDFENEPVKQVRIRLVFLRNNNGLGGFDPNNNAHLTYINDKINRLNNTYSNLQSSYNNQCYDGTQGIYSDSKVSFSIQTLSLNNTTISTDTYFSGSTITSANVSVQGTGTDVWYSITSGATINGPFEVPLGATFEVKVNSTSCSN
jgi:hypothetical protein